MARVEAEMEEAHSSNLPTETTPLLNDSGSDAHPTCTSGDFFAKQQDEERTIVVEEPPLGRLILIMATAWLGIFLGALDSTVIATLSAPIASEFNTLSLLSWLVTAYLISNAATQPIAGRLTDIFGRRLGLILSNLLFAIGNLVCGLSTDHYSMIIGRIIAGVGGGGLISIATFLTSDLTPLRKRGIMQGIANLWYGAGAMLGAVIGGLFQDRTVIGWRLAFLVQVPPSLLLIPMIGVLVKVPPKQSDKSYLTRIDFLGVFFTCSFLILLLLGLNTGGNTVPWLHPLPLTTIPLSMLCFAGFIWWEGKAKQPIIPVALLRDRTVLSACSASLFISMLLMATTFYVPLYLQVLGDSTTTAGLKFLPSPLGGSIGALGTGYLMAWTGKYRPFGVIGAVVLIVGTVLFTLQDENSPKYLTCIALFFVGGGFSTVLTTATVSCLAAVDHSQQALVTSAIFLARSVGGTLGITMASAAYQSTLKEMLWDIFGDKAGGPEEIQRILDGLEELKHLPEGWWHGVMATFMESFRIVWLMMVCWAVLALFSISFVKRHTLHSRMDRK
ncbi:multidrug resistance protein fnx1 [Fusarium subglutinans]|uniref:Multidrug resistance protein fnx1 n=1 Tax=Gibberella subglutinans TaxID=42677 RepID=A0A8H5NQZ5_GIBSU|nr:multidrug resistance protein fnx1 [Fusarium subglutinans]KAF5575587.1 multidrug resistance protein fnx1 [Fusarium subglutinans]